MNHKSRENWARRSSNFTTHQDEKEVIERLREDKELQERISKPVVL